MAFIRKYFIAPAIAVLFCFNAKAQTVYYPVNSSSLLRSTVQDIAGLLGHAIGSNDLNIMEYSVLPATGIIFIYDSSISDNQSCRVEGNGSSVLKITAAQDNGLVFGIYQYLEELGYKFYQPGSVWELTPSLNTVYRPINKIYTTAYKYKSWFISGGHNRWIMDNDDTYGWDIYYGQNGHNWALYQRRNGMLGA